MSRLGDLFVLAQQVSIAAKEEASRYDAPEVDVDHVLLALLVGGGPAGRLLREQGFSLHDARRASEQVRADHIARLGIVPPALEPRPIRDPSIGDIEWSPRAMRALAHCGDRSELDLLTGLLDEPSGIVLEMLDRLGVDVPALRAELAERKVAGATHPANRNGPAWCTMTQAGFVPAPVAAVWSLVADPARRPEWDSTIGSARLVEPDVWETVAASTWPDGRALHRRAGFALARHRVTAYQVQELIEWEVTLPDHRSRRLDRQRVAVRMEPAAGGTALELTLRWPRRTGWRRLRQILLGPAHRVVARMTLVQYATSISRALR